MIIKGTCSELEGIIGNLNCEGKLDDSDFLLEDGVWFSEEEPVMIGKQAVEIDTEKDFLGFPYETFTMILFKGKKPKQVSNVEGGNNYGSASYFKADKVGYYTVLAQND